VNVQPATASEAADDGQARTLVQPDPGDSGTRVEILLCGSSDRGDDGAPIAAAALIAEGQPGDVRTRIVGHLEIDDLISLPIGTGIVIVDAATGLHPGQVIDLPLSGLVDRDDNLLPRSSHALTFPEVIGLAELIRGRPLHGRIVAIGAVEFGLGQHLSRRVAAALPALAAEVRRAVDLARLAAAPERGG
jgi:hydrogenase maturation protease